MEKLEELEKDRMEDLAIMLRTIADDGMTQSEKILVLSNVCEEPEKLLQAADEMMVVIEQEKRELSRKEMDEMEISMAIISVIEKDEAELLMEEIEIIEDLVKAIKTDVVSLSRKEGVLLEMLSEKVSLGRQVLLQKSIMEEKNRTSEKSIKKDTLGNCLMEGLKKTYPNLSEEQIREAACSLLG